MRLALHRGLLRDAARRVRVLSAVRRAHREAGLQTNKRVFNLLGLDWIGTTNMFSCAVSSV